MSLTIEGKLIHIGQTEQVSDRFKKREFVVEIVEEVNGNSYANFAKFQTVQNKCDILDRYKVNDNIKVSFNIKGNRWEKDGKVNYISNLDCWRIEASGAAQEVPQPANGGSGNSDLPF